MIREIEVVDTHTGGEPTRVVVKPPFEIAGSDATERIENFRRDYDYLRRALVCEPRASEHWVAAWIAPSEKFGCEYSLVFMNNVGYLGMCGHGTIGAAIALQHAGLIQQGRHKFETCVGDVAVELHEDNRVSIENVPSYRYRKQVPLELISSSNGARRTIHGDIAWGGNWFFICSDHGLEITKENLLDLSTFTSQIRTQLDHEKITGAGGALIDHVELIGLPSDSKIADSRSFTLCPGGQYDRSPCGTGTSAKVACMAADGTLAQGELLRQESVIGSIFEATYQMCASESVARETSCVLPTITGTAYVNAEARLLIDEKDPFSIGVV